MAMPQKKKKRERDKLPTLFSVFFSFHAIVHDLKIGTEHLEHITNEHSTQEPPERVPATSSTLFFSNRLAAVGAYGVFHR